MIPINERTIPTLYEVVDSTTATNLVKYAADSDDDFEEALARKIENSLTDGELDLLVSSQGSDIHKGDV